MHIQHASPAKLSCNNAAACAAVVKRRAQSAARRRGRSAGCRTENGARRSCPVAVPNGRAAGRAGPADRASQRIFRICGYPEGVKSLPLKFGKQKKTRKEPSFYITGALAALTDVMDQPLLTPASVALSLSPPRTPPYDSPVRKLYNDPTAARRHLAGILQARDDLNGGDASSDGGGGYQSHAIASRILQLTSDLKGLPLHPHIPSSLSLPVQVRRL